MGYELQAGEPLGEGLQRIIQEQIDHAIANLENLDDDASRAVHEARKSFKKIRAALRLVRDPLGPQIFRRQNVCFRDAGRAFSRLRDSHVRVLTVDAIARHYAERLDEDAFDETSQRLLDAHHATSHRFLTGENVPVQIIAILQEARAQLPDLPFHSVDGPAVHKGLHRVYRRGYRALAKAQGEPLPENFHDWRKRVKYLWYQTSILTPLWPGLYDDWVADLDALADCLGEANDVTHLRQHLDTNLSSSPPDERDLLLTLAGRRRAELQAQAIPLGHRIYAQTPKKFAQSLQMTDSPP